MKFLSVCSGIEAASVAWEPLGWKAVGFSEIEPFPSAVLAHHYPDVPNYGDMTALPSRILAGEVEAPDLFCGGTPCQAFSVAGLRKSLDDARGNLSLTFCEIADAIDFVRLGDGDNPCIVFWENVPGVLSTKDNAFGCFVAGLAGEDEPIQPAGQKWTDAGVVLGPQRAVAWRTLDAQYFGLAQRRRRVFVVASARDGFDPATVLLEWDGVRRDSAPSREAGEGAAARTGAGAAVGGVVGPLTAACGPNGHGGSGLATDKGAEAGHILAYGGNNTAGPIDVATARNACASASASGRMDFETETFLVQPIGVTLHGTDGTQSIASLTDLSSSLRARIPSGVENSTTTAVMQPVPFDTTQVTSATNRSKPKAGDPCHPLAAGAHPPAVAFHPTQDPISSTEVCHAIGTGSGQGCATAAVMETVGALMTHHTPNGHGCAGINNQQVAAGHVLPHAMQVRRLTPVECERLQGFPDDYTAIPWRNKPASECPDGPRYKALGNSWAVPVVRWIGQRIQYEMWGLL